MFRSGILKTKRGQETHNKIVDAALVLFSKKAVQKTTVSDICKQAGIAKGTFYIYFETKDDLVWHFVEHQFQDLMQWFASIETFGHKQEYVSQLIDYIIDFVNENSTLLSTTHDSKFLSYFDTDEVRTRLEQRMIQPVKAWLQTGIEKGYIVALDATFLSQFIVIGVHEMIDQVIAGKSDYTLQDLRTLLKETLSTILLR